MVLNEKELLAVEMVFEGKKINAAIAKELDITERTLYKWKLKPEFKDAIKEMSNAKLSSSSGKLLRNMEKIAFKGNSEFARLQATQFLIEKTGLGEADEVNINVKPVEIIDDITGKSE